MDFLASKWAFWNYSGFGGEEFQFWLNYNECGREEKFHHSIWSTPEGTLVIINLHFSKAFPPTNKAFSCVLSIDRTVVKKRKRRKMCAPEFQSHNFYFSTSLRNLYPCLSSRLLLYVFSYFSPTLHAAWTHILWMTEGFPVDWSCVVCCNLLFRR